MGHPEAWVPVPVLALPDCVNVIKAFNLSGLWCPHLYKWLKELISEVPLGLPAVVLQPCSPPWAYILSRKVKSSAYTPAFSTPVELAASLFPMLESFIRLLLERNKHKPSLMTHWEIVHMGFFPVPGWFPSLLPTHLGTWAPSPKPHPMSNFGHKELKPIFILSKTPTT